MAKLSSLVHRVLFLGAFVLAGLAVVEKLANVSGYTVVDARYEPSRLLELAVTPLLFVIAYLLREIRDGRSKAA